VRAPATTRIDRAAAALLALLAIVHTAVGLADGAALTERRLWFLAGGLALALAAALNIVATSAALRRNCWASFCPMCCFRTGRGCGCAADASCSPFRSG